jgi:excisionase family DNA binding protein
MSAYAAASRALPNPGPELPQEHGIPPLAQTFPPRPGNGTTERALDGLLDLLAHRVADLVSSRLGASLAQPSGEWLDSREAAVYLNVHRDTLRRLAAERAIPSEQDGPGCKRYFLRDDLDTWRRSGGRHAHLAAVA